MEFNVLIGGEAGQGAFSVELELTEILTRLNYYFFATKNYMSRVRGGHNFHMIRIADHPVHALRGGQWDMVIALDAEAESRHKQNIRDKGIYLAPASAREIEKEARDRFRDVRAANNILVGIVLSVIGVSRQILAEAAKPENLEHLTAGLEFAQRWNLAETCPVSPKAVCPCKLDGNQAIALGAIIGGCQFMAGYPMTPATSIMHYFATAAQRMPVHFEQAEDEISAINMALGASYAGIRSMTATSGGGFALMQEGVSLSGMTETPIVIAVSQRPGPATGLPTRTEQGDLNFVLQAGHGEFPRIIFAPGSIDETIMLAAKSFELADRYQIPVFLLTDQYLADSVQLTDEKIPAAAQSREHLIFDNTYRRYRLTADGISPLTCPGLSDALVKVDSDEHDEEGKITEDLTLRTRMVEKRRGKGERLLIDAVPPALYGYKDAGTVIICWGSNKLIVKEAQEMLAREGIETAVLHFGQVYPLTADMIAPWGLASKKLICVENNAEGQFASLMKRELGLDATHRLLKYNGECFTVEELYQNIKQLLSGRS
ncbi:MAG: 2-oxoacid:acceptor oxidoreductase subunit alpha [Deltaproteobacteria bacterium]|nr:2-oxoacid:acceptor oxidoreductase subunit alpha [Deltaproteobacteria bacterium]